jgi:hypothetical protein
MEKILELDDLDLGNACLKRELRLTIQCPDGGVDLLCKMLGNELQLKQGAYEHCLYIRKSGAQIFRALAGSHAGDEGTIQTTHSNEIVLTIPKEAHTLKKAFETIFQYGVQEEPTVHVEEVWSSHSNYLDDKNNPHRYWNRSDTDEIHGTATSINDLVNE